MADAKNQSIRRGSITQDQHVITVTEGDHCWRFRFGLADVAPLLRRLIELADDPDCPLSRTAIRKVCAQAVLALRSSHADIVEQRSDLRAD